MWAVFLSFAFEVVVGVGLLGGVARSGLGLQVV